MGSEMCIRDRSLSLRYHPDKLAGATDAQLAEAKLVFHQICEAHEILSDMATRREYDRARDKLEAEGQAGLADVSAEGSNMTRHPHNAHAPTRARIRAA
mgnify:CR=1 FL=1